LKVTVLPALTLSKVYTRRFSKWIYTFFVLREKLENNAANEGKIGWWSSQLRQNWMMPFLAD